MIPSAEIGELEGFRSLLAGQEQAEIGGALCTSFALTPGSALFNRALGLGLREPATEAALDEIDACCTRRGLAYNIALTPDAQPLELPEWLEARGFQRGYAWTKFAQSAEPSPRRESDLRVEELGADQANLFADVFVRAYGTPEVARPLLARIPGSDGWHCFLAFDDKAPAATGALFVTGSVGWLGAAAAGLKACCSRHGSKLALQPVAKHSSPRPARRSTVGRAVRTETSSAPASSLSTCARITSRRRLPTRPGRRREARARGLSEQAVPPAIRG